MDKFLAGGFPRHVRRPKLFLFLFVEHQRIFERPQINKITFSSVSHYILFFIRVRDVVGTSMLDTEAVQILRNATPGVGHVVHLNNAGASLPSQITLNSVIHYLQKEATVGGYVSLAMHVH
jgi:hypothetical protein